MPAPIRRLMAVLLTTLLVATLLQVPATPAYAAEGGELVLVLDSSGSMAEKVGGRSKISLAKEALSTVVDQLPGSARVGLRVYGARVLNRSDRGACTDSELVVPIGSGNRAALRREIKKYRPYGETPISYSLGKAADDLNGDGRRSILLVSDGEETCDVDPCDTARKIAERGIDLKIDVIGLNVAGKARRQLRCIAREGRGTYYDADSADDLEASLDKLATRAFRPFKFTGTKVRGAATQGDGPILAPGQYVDTFGTNMKPRYYRLPRSIPGSTLHVGLTARPSGDAFVPGAGLRIYDADGRECKAGIALVVSVGGLDPLLTGSTNSGSEPRCADPAELSLAITGLQWTKGYPYELVVREESPITSAAGLPPATERVAWEKLKVGRVTRGVVPGSSISDAPALTSGTYAMSILTGETQVVGVDLDWGQRLEVEAVIPPRRGALAKEVDYFDKLELQLIGPTRGVHRQSDLTIAKKPTWNQLLLSPDNKTHRVGAATAPIRYQNRTLPVVENAALPGRHYVALNYSVDDKKYLLPYRLVIKVIGRAGEGAPMYVLPSPTPDPGAATTDPSPGASSVASSPAPAPGNQSSGSRVGALAAAAGGVIIAAGGVALGLRRRGQGSRRG